MPPEFFIKISIIQMLKLIMNLKINDWDRVSLGESEFEKDSIVFNAYSKEKKKIDVYPFTLAETDKKIFTWSNEES